MSPLRTAEVANWNKLCSPCLFSCTKCCKMCSEGESLVGGTRYGPVGSDARRSKGA